MDIIMCMFAQTVENLPNNAGDPSSIPGWERSLGEGNSNPLQYSCLGNSMDRGAWWIIVHGVAKSWTWLSNRQFDFHSDEDTHFPNLSLLKTVLPWTSLNIYTLLHRIPNTVFKLAVYFSLHVWGPKCKLPDTFTVITSMAWVMKTEMSQGGCLGWKKWGLILTAQKPIMAKEYSPRVRNPGQIPLLVQLPCVFRLILWSTKTN